jgi:hypothetical protein
MRNQFKYGCECDERRCHRTFRLNHNEYQKLAAKGLVRHIECPSVARKWAVNDFLSTNEDVIVVAERV